MAATFRASQVFPNWGLSVHKRATIQPSTRVKGVEADIAHHKRKHEFYAGCQVRTAVRFKGKSNLTLKNEYLDEYAPV